MPSWRLLWRKGLRTNSVPPKLATASPARTGAERLRPRFQGRPSAPAGRGKRTHGGQPTRAEHQKATQATPKLISRPATPAKQQRPSAIRKPSAHNTRSGRRQRQTYKRKPSTTQGQAVQTTEQIDRKSCSKRNRKGRGPAATGQDLTVAQLVRRLVNEVANLSKDTAIPVGSCGIK